MQKISSDYSGRLLGSIWSVFLLLWGVLKQEEDMPEKKRCDNYPGHYQELSPDYLESPESSRPV
jgi:hypothetical protein